MKKLINKPEDIARELNNGMVKAHLDLLEQVDNDIIVRKKTKAKGKVWLVSAQGLGHEPGFNGFVGYGMHDVEVPGNIFTCAGGARIYEGIKVAWERSGYTPVLYLMLNHEGDVLNGNMAIEMAQDEGIDVDSVLLFDDIASAPKGQENKRRGMAGAFFCYKIGGALAEEGKKREAIKEKIKEVNATTRTLAVALKPCLIPTTGQPLFSLKEDELIIGPGVHGEPGPEGPMKMANANKVIEIVAEKLIDDGGFKRGDEVLVLLNGCGSTTLMELFILYNRLFDILKSLNITPYKPLVNNVMTTQEMAGFSLSMCKADEEVKRLWDAPADTPYYKNLGDRL